RLPQAKREAFLAEYEKLDAKDRLSFTEHRVEKGEPLGKIARAYGVTEAAILRTNGIRSYRQIKPGRMLVIPMAGASRGMLAGSPPRRDPRPPQSAPREPSIRSRPATRSGPSPPSSPRRWTSFAGSTG